ncbi:putative metal-binding protein conserved in archaea [Haladaptatus paucihalophilus DX253]|uniref:Putative metal-binding protein conserved in archaea n=1 Tax=Haladaptatus paucihalophilus DX253 TaxID=797209 RepID=E7QW71_HALPU|nr:MULTISPECIES: UPF0058 family protein [Haladaptatus]EFW91205.1 putative metal-binding protein conserved in archaea [Haladaptatus paucihalophilus DX253]ODR81807.1 metal-binding protein [Haladaptatus sp. W1]SHL65317.1 hypothetical protein SAMN05444342_4331 [Haladaptatus paucihalophilus DX253]
MKKQELIHLHGLLSEVRNRFETQTDSTFDLSAYDEQTTRPTSIHHSKNDHREAVLKLANDLTTSMMSEETETVAPHAD